MSSRVARYPGTELTAEETCDGTYLATRHQADLDYAWTSGVAISRFLAGLRDGEIWARSCRSCGRTMVPPRMYCEVCFRPTDEWRRLPGTGRVATYSVSYVNADASRRVGLEPILVAVIELDGASPMMGILHLLGETSAERLTVGMRVEPAWRPKASRKGAITDIRYFRPMRERRVGHDRRR